MSPKKKTEKPKPIAEPSVADLDAVAHEQAVRNTTGGEHPVAVSYNWDSARSTMMGQYAQPMPALRWGFVAICVSLSVVAVLLTGWGLFAYVHPKFQITVTQQPPAAVTMPQAAACSDAAQPVVFDHLAYEGGVGLDIPTLENSLLLTATDTVWIKVQDRVGTEDGITLFEGTVPQGWKKIYMLSSARILVVRTGKPDALQFRLGDQELALNNDYAGTRNLGVYVVDGKKLLK